MGTKVDWRILAVEDSASARKLLQEILIHLGFSLQNIRFAGEPQEAQRLFAEWRPNVVLLDMDLGRSRGGSAGTPEPAKAGEVDGQELGRRFLSRNPGLQLVIVTALDLDSPPVKALRTMGAAAVIQKPVLAARVSEVLSNVTPRPSPEPSGPDWTVPNAKIQTARR